jgi:nuclear transport factor 2 (NTF2) superfamily protein
MPTSEAPRPPLPPFDTAAATQKLRLAEDAWNTRDPQRVAMAFSPESVWRNRSEFFPGRQAIWDFLTRKWARGLDYRLIKELWIAPTDRKCHWALGRRPDDHPGLSALGL